MAGESGGKSVSSRNNHKIFRIWNFAGRVDENRYVADGKYEIERISIIRPRREIIRGLFYTIVDIFEDHARDTKKIID